MIVLMRNPSDASMRGKINPDSTKSSILAVSGAGLELSGSWWLVLYIDLDIWDVRKRHQQSEPITSYLLRLLLQLSGEALMSSFFRSIWAMAVSPGGGIGTVHIFVIFLALNAVRCHAE